LTFAFGPRPQSFGAHMPIGILIIDDSPEVRNMVKSWLERDNKLAVCGEASGGAEGIEKALLLKPDVIVLDFSMPGMDGLTAATALQTAMPGVPIIMLTLYADSELAHQALEAGVSTILSKMEEMSVLCDEVERLAGTH